MIARDSTKYSMEILEIIIIVFALAWFSKTFLLGFAQVNDNDMLPTLGNNTQILVNKGVHYFAGSLEKGDILVYTDGDLGIEIKRLIGLPGDKVEIKNGYAYVNDRPLYEPYAHTPIDSKFSAITIPENHFFVLNDNRGVYNDSRKIGSIPKDKLIGQAVFSYWPWYKIKSL